MKNGLVEELLRAAPAAAEEGKSAVAKTDALERGKRCKRTERLKILENELKKSLYAASTHQLPVATEKDDDEEAVTAEDGEGLLLPRPRPRIIISGFSNCLLNGIYEESSEKGQDNRPVLRHVHDENLCLEYLNGGPWPLAAFA